MNDFPDDDDLFLDPEAPSEADAPQPFWTRRRIFLTLIAVIIVITLLAYTLSGLVHPAATPANGRPRLDDLRESYSIDAAIASTVLWSAARLPEFVTPRTTP